MVTGPSGAQPVASGAVLSSAAGASVASAAGDAAGADALLPQAHSANTMHRARISARYFFIFVFLLLKLAIYTRKHVHITTVLTDRSILINASWRALYKVPEKFNAAFTPSYDVGFRHILSGRQGGKL